MLQLISRCRFQMEGERVRYHNFWMMMPAQASQRSF